MPSDSALMQRSPDALDSAICEHSGHNFLTGQAFPPEKRAFAEQEGWICVRDRQG